MSAETPAPRTGTRWGRFLVPMTLGLTLVGGAASLILTNVVAVQLTLQGNGMQFNSSKIYGQDVGFGMVPVTVRDPATGTVSTKPVLRAGVAVATLNGLCVSKTETVAGVTVTVKLTAGNGTSTDDISAKAALFDLTDLGVPGSGGSKVTGIALGGTDQIGLATTDITTTRADPSQPVSSSNPYDSNPLWPETTATGDPIVPAGNGQGWTGIDATTGTLSNVYGTLWDAQIDGSIMLPNLSISVSPGTTQSCVAAAQAGSFTQ